MYKHVITRIIIGDVNQVIILILANKFFLSQ